MEQTPNPYATKLGGRDAKEVIKETSGKLKNYSGLLVGDKASRSYAPGKWTAREIFCHLADVEIAFSFRLRQAIAQNDHLIQPFDQDAWAENYTTADPAAALQVFSNLRDWNLAFLRGLPENMMSKSLTHPERGKMVFLTLLQTMAGHDLNHLEQLATIAGS